MTVPSTDIDAVQSAAAAVVRCLPVTELSVGQVIEGAAGLGQAALAPNSQAVVAALTGSFAGQLMVTMSPELAQQVENGPFGPQDLVAALDAGLTDATAAVATYLGDIRHEVAQSLPADIALESAAQYEHITVVQIVAEGFPVGAVVILVEEPQAASVASFDSFSDGGFAPANLRGVDVINDVEMGVTAELGRTRMTVRELLGLQPGSIVELDRAAGSPVDLLVNGTLVARGEVVVIDEEFGVRITEIIGYDNKPNNK